MSTPKSPRYNQNQEEIIELCGVSNWAELQEWFGGMTEDEILAEANNCWRHEDNTGFASRVYQALK